MKFRIASEKKIEISRCIGKKKSKFPTAVRQVLDTWPEPRCVNGRISFCHAQCWNPENVQPFFARMCLSLGATPRPFSTLSTRFLFPSEKTFLSADARPMCLRLGVQLCSKICQNLTKTGPNHNLHSATPGKRHISFLNLFAKFPPKTSE